MFNKSQQCSIIVDQQMWNDVLEKKDKIKGSSSQEHCSSKISRSKIGLFLSQHSIMLWCFSLHVDLNVVTSAFESSEFLLSHTAILLRPSVLGTYSRTLNVNFGGIQIVDMVTRLNMSWYLVQHFHVVLSA